MWGSNNGCSLLYGMPSINIHSMVFLVTINWKWRFKGSLKLITLEGDFFFFKILCEEDYDFVWDSGSYFLSGRLFFF